MGIFSPDVWTHCNYIAETFRDMFLTPCDTSVPTFTILQPQAPLRYRRTHNDPKRQRVCCIPVF